MDGFIGHQQDQKPFEGSHGGCCERGLVRNSEWPPCAKNVESPNMIELKVKTTEATSYVGSPNKLNIM